MIARKGLFTVLGLTVLVTTACSSTREEFEEVVIPIQGTWTLNAALTEDMGTLACDVQDVILNVQQQTGDLRLFGGTAVGGTISCTRGGETDSRDLQSLQIAGGRQREGITVLFNLTQGDTFLDFEGELGEFSWSGEVFGLLVVNLLGEELVALRGTFTAQRIIS